MPKLILILLCFCYHIAMSQQKEQITLYFEFDKTLLTKTSSDSLGLLIDKLLNKPPQKISIKAYADKNGTGEYNKELSRERAAAIATLLKNNIPPGTIMLTDNFGSADLLTKNDDEQYLNRRAEIIIEFPATIVANEVTELEPFKEDVTIQQFNIDLDDTVHIIAEAGTVIKIPPGSIQNKKGKPANGKAKLLLKEYYDPGKIIKAGLNSDSENGLLQTGGMVFITITQDEDTMDSRTLKPIVLQMPVRNPELTNMNVFVQDREGPGHDTARWNNTGATFISSGDLWKWDTNKAIADLYVDTDGRYLFNKMAVGKTYEDEYYTRTSWISFNPDKDVVRRNLSHPLAKKVWYSYTKVDSVTIKIQAHFKYRARGKHIFGKKYFDTSFYAYYTKPFYKGEITKMSWINCDRFYQYKDRINQYVTTPGYSGMNVMVYFKNLRGYLPAFFNGKKFVAKQIPPGEEVILIAMGKKGDQYYFGRKDYTSSKKDIPEIAIKKSDMEEINRELDKLR